MLLSQLEYFVALASTRHFGRAAAQCFVSPSTLAEAIRKLEVEMGVPLVVRSRSFQGLTDDGQLVLTWARKIVADHRALMDALAVAHGDLTGEARLGTIPSAMSLAAELVDGLAASHPGVSLGLRSGLTSEEIVALLRSHELDAGLIHPSTVDGPDLHAVTVQRIRAVVMAPTGVFPADTAAISGEMLALAPVGLLEAHMRARQIFDAAMADVGITIEPRIVSDSIEGLLRVAMGGRLAVVVPAALADRTLLPDDLRILELLEPSVHMPIAYVRLRESLLPPLSLAFDAAVAALTSGP